MREKVLRHIRERQLMSAGDRVCVAVSGGADSVALLRVLLELRNELGIVLSVAHFNHGLRGEASEADAAFVAELARQHDLEFFSGSGDVRDHALTNKLSVETAARELRYGWFGLLAGQKKLDAIATGHTLDDQAETVLLKFLRGAGTRGLAGIYPKIAIGAEAPDPAWSAEPLAGAVPARGVEPEGPGLFHFTEPGGEETVSQRRMGLPQSKEADKNQPRMGRKSLAQHGAAGGVLGKQDNATESRRGGRGYDTVSNAALHKDDATHPSRARIIRPLLKITRNEVEQYLTTLGQEWREDESNLDHRFTRNRVRHELLPLLELGYNPNIRQVLSDTAELSRAEEEYWQALVEREVQDRRVEIDAHADGKQAPHGLNLTPPSAKAALVGDPGSPVRAEAVPVQGGLVERCLSLDGFAGLPLALQRRLLRRWLQGCQIASDFEHIAKLLHCAWGELPQAELPGGWLAVRRGDFLELRRPPAARPFDGYNYSLSIPGEVHIADLNLTVRSVPVPEQLARAAGSPDGFLSADLLCPELTVRNWRPGDRFWPVHSKSEEKLKRLFSEQHIPAEQRQSWPVVLAGEQIVWVRGFPVARAFAWSGSGDAVKIEVL